MTAIYQSLENSMRSYVLNFFPTWTVKFMYDNAAEPTTPYLAIDIRSSVPIGREYISTTTTLDDQDKLYTTTTQTYQSTVRFEFVGKFDETSGTVISGEMAQQLEFNMRTQAGYEYQSYSGLSLMGMDRVRRLPVKRETDTYLYYQLDVTFAYAVTETVEQQYMVDLGINGVYYNAGRSPTHTIETTLTIDPDA